MQRGRIGGGLSRRRPFLPESFLFLSHPVVVVSGTPDEVPVCELWEEEVIKKLVTDGIHPYNKKPCKVLQCAQLLDLLALGKNLIKESQQPASQEEILDLQKLVIEENMKLSHQVELQDQRIRVLEEIEDCVYNARKKVEELEEQSKRRVSDLEAQINDLQHQLGMALAPKQPYRRLKPDEKSPASKPALSPAAGVLFGNAPSPGVVKKGMELKP